MVFTLYEGIVGSLTLRKWDHVSLFLEKQKFWFAYIRRHSSTLVYWLVCVLRIDPKLTGNSLLRRYLLQILIKSMVYKLCKQKRNFDIKTFVSARKHLTLTCGSLFATNLKIEVERKVIVLQKNPLLGVQQKSYWKS